MKLPKYNLCYNTRGLIKSLAEKTIDWKHDSLIVCLVECIVNNNVNIFLFDWFWKSLTWYLTELNDYSLSSNFLSVINLKPLPTVQVQRLIWTTVLRIKNVYTPLVQKLYKVTFYTERDCICFYSMSMCNSASWKFCRRLQLVMKLENSISSNVANAKRKKLQCGK